MFHELTEVHSSCKQKMMRVLVVLLMTAKADEDYEVLLQYSVDVDAAAAAVAAADDDVAAVFASARVSYSSVGQIDHFLVSHSHYYSTGEVSSVVVVVVVVVVVLMS